MRILLVAILQLFFTAAFAQTQSYTSQIIDEENMPVPGANVHLVGTQTYSITNTNGVFTIQSASSNFKLQVSYLGFETTNVPVINGDIPPSIILKTSTLQLNEFVVTALGIDREKQSLTSAVTKIDNKQLTQVPMTNVVNSLAGQVAGVQTTNGSSGVGSSSRIIIRGENSLSGSNQPLFVVDGVPISNETITSDLFNVGNTIQEVDWGNGAAEINPDDMESITILKGPGSAALYGTRASNGVVVINTKRGKEKKGLGVSTSSSFTVDRLLTVPDYQNVFGGGSNGEYSFVDGVGGGTHDGGISSYGPALDTGLNIQQFDSPSFDVDSNVVRAGDVIARTKADGSLTDITATPWVSHPDNVRDFFQTGVTAQNNIAISSTSDNGSVRLSYTNFRNKGIIPGTNLERDGISLGLTQNLTDKLTVDAFVDYIYSRSENRPNLGYGYENVMYGFNWTGRNTDISSLRDYWQAGQVDVQHYDFNYKWVTNPYLTLYENTNSFKKNRVLGNASANYDFTDKFSLRIRTGIDNYADNRVFKRAFSTNSRPYGEYREDNVGFQEINSDFLFTWKDQINKDIKYSVSAGGNRLDQKINYEYTEASQLAVPGVYTLANSRVPLIGSSQIFDKRINSLYGIGNVSYKNIYYLDLTVRNDWSSTLPADNNSFAYYSSGLGYVISNNFELPEPLTYAKVRINASSVGNDTDPYQLNNTFQFNQNYGSFFRVTNESVLKNSELKPERLNAYEAGAELWFFNNRIQTDFAVYQNTSVNQIIGRPVSTSAGYSNIIENGGTVRTRGFEGMLSAKIIDNDKFQWVSSLNYSTYESIVTQLPEGVDQYVTGEADVFRGGGGSNTVFYIAKEGGRVGDMYGTGFQEENGQIIYGPDGLPIQDGTLRLLGNYNPDFTLGWNNQFTWKGITLGVLFDWRKGGTIVSRTKALGSTSGVLQETLVGRDGGVIGDGVMNIGNEESPVYVPNTTSVSASTFYNTFYDRGNEASSLYSASYLKLRQVSLYYSLPMAACQRIGFQKIEIGLVGSNLLLFTENPHFDPELSAMQGRNFTYGVEDMSYPSSRSFGISLKTQF